MRNVYFKGRIGSVPAKINTAEVTIKVGSPLLFMKFIIKGIRILLLWPKPSMKAIAVDRMSRSSNYVSIRIKKQ